MENGGKLLKAVGRLTRVVILAVELIKHIKSAFFTHMLCNTMNSEKQGLTA